MSKKMYEESNISAIASAIRSKLGVQTTYLVSQMAAAIGNIVTPNLQIKTATENGITVVPDSGYNGLSSVIVNIQTGGDDIQRCPRSEQDTVWNQLEETIFFYSTAEVEN